MNIFWSLHFDDAEALDYIFAYFDKEQVFLSYHSWLFCFSKAVDLFCSWFFFFLQISTEAF